MSNVVLLRPYGPSKALDALARDSQTKSVEAHAAGDEVAYATHLANMMAFDTQAALARRWENRCAELARGASHILNIAARQHAKERR